MVVLADRGEIAKTEIIIIFLNEEWIPKGKTQREVDVKCELQIR